jgi:Matrixin
MGSISTYPAVIDGPSVVERSTRMTANGSRARVSMIPASFDLRAFDEMFRTSNAQLQRWTSRPALVVLAAVMDYRNTSDQIYTATGEQLTDAELEQLKAHLMEGLAFLTGNTYTSFASVEIERPTGGARVNTLRAGQIVVGRYNGVANLAKTIGYGMWSEQPDGSIGGGAMYLDRNFDKDDNRRRLLRIHELGHALGYQHVESRTSIMNPSIGPEPNEFDRGGAIIAFARPVGNKSPDVDPTSAVVSVSTGEGHWRAPATACALPVR